METTHRDICVATGVWLLQQYWCDLAAVEIAFATGIGDAIGISSSPKKQSQRLTLCECKRTRSDLLSDLRAKKLLKYEAEATHCILVATKEAYLWKQDKTKADVLNDLKEKGLPDHWGIAVIEGSEITLLRKPKKIQALTQEKKNEIVLRVAKSYCYKYLAQDPPRRKRKRSRRRRKRRYGK